MPDRRSDFAKSLRSQMTDAERTIWRQLRGHRLQGYKFKRQEPIGPYIADFVCYQVRVIIELDGGQHLGSERDARRDVWFQENGFKVLRFWNDRALLETEAVLEEILRTLESPLSPNPSPARGEGSDA